MAERFMAEYETESISGLIRSVLDDTRELIREEIALARAEVREEVASARTVGISFGVAAVAAIIGTILLCVTLGQALAYFLHWPTWAGLGIMTLLLLGGAFATIQYGRRHMAKVRALPITTESVKENLAWMRQSRSAGR